MKRIALIAAIAAASWLAYACGATTSPLVEGAQQLVVTCFFECTVTRIDYCNVNCGNTGSVCFPTSWPMSGTPPPAPILVGATECNPPSMDPLTARQQCITRTQGDAARMQTAVLDTLGIRRRYPCGPPDSSSALPHPEWNPQGGPIFTGLSCTPRPVSEAQSSITVCYR